MKYVVKQDRDGVGYRVVEMVCGMEMFIKGASLNREEMIELAKKLQEELNHEENNK